MKPSAEFWNRIAQKYASSPVADMAAYDYTMERTKAYLNENDQVLELGCGTGTTALRLASSVKKFVATDFASEMINIANKKLKDSDITNVVFQTSAADGISEEDRQFDVVMGFNLFHLIERPEEVFARISDHLKPGGYFISKTVCKPGADAPLKFKLIKLVLPVMQWFGKAPFVNFMEIAELEALIEKSGFKIVETGNYPSAPPNRFVVAQKI